MQWNLLGQEHLYSSYHGTYVHITLLVYRTKQDLDLKQNQI